MSIREPEDESEDKMVDINNLVAKSLQRTPSGTEGEKPMVVEKEAEPDMATEIAGAVRKVSTAMSIANIANKITGAGGKEEQSGGFKLTGNLDIGSIFGTALQAIQQSSANLAGQAQSQMENLRKEFQEKYKEFQATPRGESNDPLAALKVYSEITTWLQGVTDKLKANSGITAQIPPTDIAGLVKLEEVRLDREERRHQFEEKMAEERRRWDAEQEDKRHQWAREDQKFTADLQVSIAKLNQDNKNKDHILENIGDIVSSAGAALAGEKGSVDNEVAGKVTRVQKVGAAEVGVQPRLKIKSFDCIGCGTKIDVPGDAKLGDSVHCPNEDCASEYVLDPVQKK